MARLNVQAFRTGEVAGLGEKVVKLMDDSNRVICFIGTQNGEEKIHFPTPISVAELEAVAEHMRLLDV